MLFSKKHVEGSSQSNSFPRQENLWHLITAKNEMAFAAYSRSMFTTNFLALHQKGGFQT